jgi:DNA-binding transcriptional LysR family regulator
MEWRCETLRAVRALLSGVEVRHLLALQGVVEAGSFRGAAERLGYSQGSVSAQIGALEQMIGTQLLERAPGRPVRLTAAGGAFYPHAVEALVRLRSGAEDAVGAEKTKSVARLRIGTYPSAAARLLPALLDRLIDAQPDAEVSVSEASIAEELERAVEDGRLDLTFTVQPFRRQGVEGIALLEDPFCLVVARSSALADRAAPLGPDDLAEQPLILSGTCTHMRHLETRLRLRGHEPRIAMRTDDDGFAHGLAAAGLGAAVLTRLQLDPYRDDVVAIELVDVLPPRIVALAWARDRPLPRLAVMLRDWAAEGTFHHSLRAS